MTNERFHFIWETGKGMAIRMPSSFADLFSSNEGEISLLFQDNRGRKFPVLYDRTRNEIATRTLIDWVRNHEPKHGDLISLRCLDLPSRLFRIALDEQDEVRPPEGLYLGKQKDALSRFRTDRNFYLDLEDLVTHVFICGVTGTGKTVMGKTIIEEAVQQNVPAIIVDLKGDLSSLALLFSTLDESEFEPWVAARAGFERRDLAQREAERYRERDTFFGTTEAIARLKERASFAVFTPKVGKGIPLAIASPLAAPADIQDLLQSEPATVLDMADSFSTTFVKTLFPDQKLSRLKKFIAYLQELVRFCWEQGINLEGQLGLSTIQSLILNPPIQRIGGMTLDDFISDKSRKDLASQVAMCLSGAGQLWFRGVPLDIDVLLDRPNKSSVPVSIINLRELPTFDDQMHAVSHLAFALYHWVRRKGDAAGRPRLVFFIDEIGGGGGRNAFFPSHPYDPASKPGLNLLLRQGRTFGLCCVFATQNPGDVDYKGLSNCQTWMVSRLQTKRDREKILQGMSAAELSLSSVDDILRDIEPGQFLIKPRTGENRVVQQRWLMSYHKTLSESEVARINAPEILSWYREKYPGTVRAQ